MCSQRIDIALTDDHAGLYAGVEQDARHHMMGIERLPRLSQISTKLSPTDIIDTGHDAV